jgi:ABC-type transporter Mla subunit MlaD
MADIPESILLELQKLDKRLQEHEAPTKKAFDTAMRDAKKAIDDESEDEIELAGPLIDDAIEKVDQSLHACKMLHGLVDKLQKQPEFLKSHREPIVKVVQHFGPKQKELAKWAEALRQLSADASKALGAAKKGATETEADLAEVKNLASGVADEIKTYVSEVPKLEKIARADATAKVAEQARLRLIDILDSLDGDSGFLKKRVDEFQKAHPDIDRAMKNELQSAIDTLQNALDLSKQGHALLLVLLKLKQQQAADNAQRPPPPVPKSELIKVAPIVGIDPKDSKALGKLADVINDSPHEKWADGLTKLATQLKLKNTAGKTMVEAIDRLSYFKSRAAAH